MGMSGFQKTLCLQKTGYRGFLTLDVNDIWQKKKKKSRVALKGVEGEQVVKKEALSLVSSPRIANKNFMLLSKVCLK